MVLHFGILFGATLLSKIYDYFCERKKKVIRYVFLVVMIILLSVFIGYRSINTGIDTSTYYAQYARHYLNFDLTEIAFPILIYIGNILGLNYSQYFTVVSLITLVGTLGFVHIKMNIDHAIYTFLYISSFAFLYSCSASRFVCALSFAIIAMYYACNKKYVFFIGFIIVAMTFHFSALIFILAYFYSKNYPSKTFWIITLLIVIIFTLLNILGSNMLIHIVSEKYAYVIFKSGNNLGISTIKTIVEFCILYHFKNTISENKNEYEFFLGMLILSAVLDICPGTYRLIWFFKYPTWLLWAILMKNLQLRKTRLSKSNARVLGMSLVIVYSVWYYYLLRTMGMNQHLIPYIFS